MNSYATEDQFRKHFELTCQAMGARYTQIPDVHKAAYSLNGYVPAVKRPCDGVFETVQGMAWIELKIQHGKLKPHQRVHLAEAEKMHGKAYVLRAKELKAGLSYYIENSDHEVIAEVKEIRELVTELTRLIIFDFNY